MSTDRGEKLFWGMGLYEALEFDLLLQSGETIDGILTPKDGLFICKYQN